MLRVECGILEVNRKIGARVISQSKEPVLYEALPQTMKWKLWNLYTNDKERICMFNQVDWKVNAWQ